jgi:DUF1680 family protein
MKKYEGKTDKGCYKHYYVIPKWWEKHIHPFALWNSQYATEYWGYGYNKKTRDWSEGHFMNWYLEDTIKKLYGEPDFIIHFGKTIATMLREAS